jgi:pyruvate/2-oxoglutarate dehydrogenase complex dihydrolipoamide acyltransferase (E2) component
MSTEVKLPRLGQGMESGVVVRWLKKEGETVAKGDPLYELDTEKVTQEIEAEADGVLLRIVVPEGEVEVGTTLAVIGAEGESADGDSPRPEAAEAKAPEAEPLEDGGPGDGGRAEGGGGGAPRDDAGDRRRGHGSDRRAAAASARTEP